MALSVSIKKKLGNILLNVKFEAENGVLALLGASGCGKSMTLKCIAGIETPDEGQIVLDGVTLFDSEKRMNLPPQKRRVGYLFQQYALFPNMTVRQNIGCGVRNRKERDKVVTELIHMMELEGMEQRHPQELSGGQQQRVALARILANEPEVLLLDEPFSALDTHLRFQLERKVQEILKSYGKTVVLVTHDRDEAFRFADNMALMADGYLDTIGRKKAVFHNPQTRSGAILTGCKNISKAVKQDETHVYAEDWDLTLEIPVRSDSQWEEVSYVGIRMHDIEVYDVGRHNQEWCNVGADKQVLRNAVVCQVLDVIEEPFSYTVRVKPVGTQARSCIGVWMEKPVWENINGKELRICIPPDAVLMLK